ncbi:hypothetical protein MBOU_30330 [Mycobacterium bourgelatii]|uniref:Uncharacterized protein n=1 Tax=Mycobacterium bourgelatii TaxID=1273442 RepID=A0A7I9YQP2_MYCBU|nr:hypothetical protein MBOU_30330 [Mycobacterium bourgelatii]
MIPEHAPHNVADDVADDLEKLATQIDALRKLEKLDGLSEDQLYDFRVQWGAALAARLRRLAQYNAMGMFDGADEVEFQTLRSELDELSGLIDRFQLARPKAAAARRRYRSA